MERVTALARDVFGAQPAAPPVPVPQVRLPDPALPAAARGALEAAVGPGHVRSDRESRIGHTRGRSTSDLLRLRAGDALDAPDAVVEPGDHDEVLAVLQAATAHRVAVVPYGGGTSVVGGLVAARAGVTGVVALDLRRLDRLVAVDAESQTATLEAGLRAPDAEALLAARGLTLGHVPQSFGQASIGGFAATRSVGQASGGYGRFDELVVGLRVATPVGTWELGHAPASAAGPDLRQLVLGSEGAFGVVTAVTVRVRPVPQARRFEGWALADWPRGLGAVRRLAQSDAPPTVLRLSDPAETAVQELVAGSVPEGERPPAGGCLLVVGFEGPADVVARHRDAAAALLAGEGAHYLGTGPGERWRASRFDAPRLRDALLDAGVLAETLETAAFWSRLPQVHAAVGDALQRTLGAAGAAAMVTCHVSHAYPTGASLYFTVAAAQGPDPVARWQQAKAAAGEAIVAAGATITHHHAVGTEHRPWLEAEIGAIGVEVLRAVKATLDPAGILNPGVLVPPRQP